MDLSKYYFINNSLYGDLGSDDRAYLKQVSQRKVFARGKDIFKENTYPQGVYVLDSGKVKIYQKTAGGFQQIMNIHIAGEIFGYRPLLCDEKFPVSATAIESCVVSFIPKKYFFLLLRRSGTLSTLLLRFLSFEFTVWVNTISNVTQRSVRERLLLNLLILVEKYRIKKLWPVEITLSRADFASLIGTSNETLARIIKGLKQDHYISFRGRTIIINGPEQLKKITNLIHDVF